MTGARATGVWAASFLDELNRAGVDTVCVAPGSRSTPLVLAAASQPGLRLVTHLDERSAAFFALGLGKASGRPAAVITTSGTAAANLLPAVVEASQGGVPLILLTADRPHRLRGADANQAIDQTHLYGRYVRRFVEAAPPSDDPAALRHLRILADRAVADATGSDPGPVHVNFPFDKPLEPASPAHVPGPAEGHSSGEPLTRVEFAHETPLDDQADAWTTMLAGARRPLIVAGYQVQPGRTGPAILGLAAAAGVPVLADPLSGARFGPGRGAARIGSYDLFLRDPEVASRLRPDLVIRLGASPTSGPLVRYLESHRDAVQAVASGGGRWKDHEALASHYYVGDVGALAESVGDRLEGRGVEEGWTERWERLDQAAAEATRPANEPMSEPRVMTGALAAAVAGGATLFVSNSMPVRDLDAFGGVGDEALDVEANRGASGIDGIVSTAAGLSLGSEAPLVCVLGDLAFYHDMNGLLATRETGVAVTYVVVHNDGGGIFHMLPIREFDPAFTAYFATPHGLDFRHTAALYDLPYQRVATAGELDEAITRGVAVGGSRIIEVRTDREDNRSYRERAAAAAAAAVTRVLNQEPQESTE